MSRIVLLLALLIGGAPAYGELPPPTADEAARLAEKKEDARREAEEQAVELTAAMDAVAARYRARMKAEGRPVPAPVPVAGTAAQRRELKQYIEPSPPSVHSAAPTTTAPPTGRTGTR